MVATDWSLSVVASTDGSWWCSSREQSVGEPVRLRRIKKRILESVADL